MALPKPVGMGPSVPGNPTPGGVVVGVDGVVGLLAAPPPPPPPPPPEDEPGPPGPPGPPLVVVVVVVDVETFAHPKPLNSVVQIIKSEPF